MSAVFLPLFLPHVAWLLFTVTPKYQYRMYTVSQSSIDDTHKRRVFHANHKYSCVRYFNTQFSRLSPLCTFVVYHRMYADYHPYSCLPTVYETRHSSCHPCVRYVYVCYLTSAYIRCLSPIAVCPLFMRGGSRPVTLEHITTGYTLITRLLPCNTTRLLLSMWWIRRGRH